MAREVHAEVWEEPSGRWRARLDADPVRVASGRSMRECLDRLGAAVGGDVLLVRERPRLVGVAEAASILGWDKRRVVTYVDRGRFPVPLAHLAGGRVWRREDVEAWAREWHDRQKRRRRAE